MAKPSVVVVILLLLILPFAQSHIYLDVDNTLYREQDHGIERQIAKNIHEYCHRYHQLSPEECDSLHFNFGSTIQGMQEERINVNLAQFYQQVYRNVDVSSLLSNYDPDGSLSTGYSHTTRQHKQQLKALLESNRVSVASNSPSHHVQKVIQALGLAKIPFERILTPDTVSTDFPTKLDPRFFPEDGILIDDSKHTCKALRQRRMRTLHMDHDSLTLWDALTIAKGWMPKDYSFCRHYTFNQIEYLKHKNKVDLQSIHRPTWNRVLDELKARRKKTLRIVDLGAGLLSMLSLVDKGHEDLLSLIQAVKPSSVEYYAYEPNRKLENECVKILEKAGFRLNETVNWSFNQDYGTYDPEYVFCRQQKGKPTVSVHLRFWDYRKYNKEQPTPHLILGCCFADLMNPDELAESVLARFLSKPEDDDTDALVYFPITFAGVTQFEPPLPFNGTTPSDTLAFSLYSRTLEEVHGHNLDPGKIVASFENFGAAFLGQGPSDWKIVKEEHGYLWYTMMHFFGSVAAPAIEINKWNASLWIDRAHKESPLIRAANTDLLFRMPCLGRWNFPQVKHASISATTGFSEISFTAPGTVTTANKQRHPLKGNEVRIKSEYSLISSGTELKIFKGLFDDAALDVNIESMAEERMAYPMSYGYSLVGRVIECGEDVVDKKELLGQLVFTFSPHAEEVISTREAIQVVPYGIAAKDAIFMPSVETALSIVHDAHVRLGERIAVYGQGIIGLLITAILRLESCRAEFGLDESLGSITVFDKVPERLVYSSRFGASQALFPAVANALPQFDVCIEASGNPRALQSAIDTTRNGGRIVLASWYGNDTVNLKLGIDFHRSHKMLITSQVSTLPAHMTATWDKGRRFTTTWNLLRLLRPSRLLSRTLPLHDAQTAYELLANGSELSIAFDYT